MRNISLIIIITFLSSCLQEDIEYKKYKKDKLKNDVKILKGIVVDMHAGAYSYNTPQQLNFLFDSIENAMDGAMDLRTFYNKIDFIADRIKCIHTEVYFPTIFFDSINNREKFFPTKLAIINNNLYVNIDNQNIPLGAQVLSINDIDAAEIITKVKKYKHADGNSDVSRNAAIKDDFAYNFYLNYGGYDKFKIKFLRDSSTTIELKTFVAEKLSTLYDNYDYSPFNSIPKDVDYDLYMDEKTKTAILSITTFSFKTKNGYNAFIHFLSNSFKLIKLSGYKNLVIDCRENGGGYYDATYSTLSYLVNKNMQEFDSCFQRYKTLTYTQYIAPEDTAKINEEDTAYKNCTKINNKLYKLKNDEISKWYPENDIYTGKIFLLINGNVASAASTFAAVLKDKTNAILVGEETGGSNNAHNSAVINFILPYSQLKVAIPLRRYIQPIIKIEKNRGVIPNIQVANTVRDLINGNDKPMAYIFDSIIENKKLTRNK